MLYSDCMSYYNIIYYIYSNYIVAGAEGEKATAQGQKGQTCGKADTGGPGAAPYDSPAAAFILFSFLRCPAPTIYKYIGYYVITIFVYCGIKTTFFTVFRAL